MIGRDQNPDELIRDADEQRVSEMWSNGTMNTEAAMSYTTTLSAIRSHGPCASGWKTLITALGDYGDETPLPLARIVETNGIGDALWAVAHVLPEDVAKRLGVTFACDCAERALPKFEAKYPTDNHPRNAIEAARRWLADPTDENRRAAAYAAYAAYAAAAAYAADAAADAAYAADDDA